MLMAVVAWALAQPPGPLQTAEHPEHGTYLVDRDGMSLYAFLPDQQGESTCYDQCAEAWPPYLASDEDAAVGGQGLEESLIASVARDDGALQVTYGDWPLYRYAQDEQPGDVAGQGVGGNWFLISPEGDVLDPSGDSEGDAEDSGNTEGDGEDSGDTEGDGETSSNAEPATSEEASSPEGAAANGGDQVASLMSEGSSVYSQHCASCHGPQGDEAGGGATVLAGHTGLSNTGRMIRQVLFGSEYMPSFAETLSDHQIAAVLTHVRNSWGNDFGPVTEEEVVAEREKFE